MADGDAAWVVTAAVASAISAAASAFALVFSASQSRSARRTTELGILQSFAVQTRELWDACRTSGEDSASFEVAVSDILGHFELYVIAISDGELSTSSQEYIVETISDYLSKMAEAGYGVYVCDMIDQPHVCKKLRDFCLQYRRKIKHAEKVFEMMQIPRSSL